MLFPAGDEWGKIFLLVYFHNLATVACLVSLAVEVSLDEDTLSLPGVPSSA